jgi:hypothetical protein
MQATGSKHAGYYDRGHAIIHTCLSATVTMRQRISLRILCVSGFLILAAGLTVGAAWIDEYKSGIVWPEPPVVDPGDASRPPSDAVVLFDGKDLSKWEGGENWTIENGVATAAKNGITTRQGFADCQLHLEFATPEKVEGEGQGRGNSGVYLMGVYEVQILDSFENKTYFDGQAASVYKQQPPTVNASRKPGEWQTYDILFTAPKFDAEGKVTKPAFVTVLHNGVAVHNHFELLGITSYTEAPSYKKHGEKEPIHLQFHGNPVKFRNIWLRENVQPLVGQKPQN